MVFVTNNRPLIYPLACILLKSTSFVTFTMLPVCWLRLTANICNLPIWTSAGGGVPWREADTGSSAQITPGLWMEGGGTSCPWSGVLAEHDSSVWLQLIRVLFHRSTCSVIYLGSISVAEVLFCTIPVSKRTKLCFCDCF